MTGIVFNSHIPEPRAVFRFETYGGNVIAVVGIEDGRSVTNDAEAVIAQLAEKFDLSKFRVIYQDTRGIWDELLVGAGSRFTGFRSINEATLEAALAKVARS